MNYLDTIKRYIKQNWKIYPQLVSIKFNLDPYLTKRFLIRNIPLFPIAIPIVLIARILKGYKLIKFGHLYGTAIGHFSTDSHVCLAEQSNHDQNTIVFLCVHSRTKKVCNLFWFEMIKRYFIIHPWVEPLDFYNRLLPGGEVHIAAPRRYPGTIPSRDIKGIIQNSNVRFNFIKQDDLKARLWMEKLCINSRNKFVTLIVRDNEYFKKLQIANGSHYHQNINFKNNEHSYRNSNINDFIPAIEYLLDLGITVIRMGKNAENPVPLSHPNLIDYPFIDSDKKSDLMDIFLMANSFFNITTGTGLDHVADIYSRPSLFVNTPFLAGLYSWADVITVPKYIRERNNGKMLNLKQLFSCPYLSLSEYNKMGLEFVNLTPIEIKDAVKERYERCVGVNSENNKNINLQIKFWKIFTQEMSNPNNYWSRQHEWIHPNCRIGSAFLANNTELLNTEDL
jgi:putative glycosyltransferase (TIGR04372 family)